MFARLEKQFFFKADLKPVLLFVAFFVFEILVFLSQPGLAALCALALIGFLPKTMITAWNHHHQHVPTFRSPFLNRVLEVIYAFQTGVLPEGWVLHHYLGHHVNLVRGAKDESAWLRPSGRVMGEWEYTLRVGLMAYPLMVRNMMRSSKVHRQRFVVGFFTCGMVYGLLSLLDPLGAFVLFFLPAVGALFGTVWHTYKHHAGLAAPEVQDACWNMLDPLYNKLTGNLGYHTAHHVSSGTHWSKLPTLHKKLEERIPDHLYRDPGMPFPIFDFLWGVFSHRDFSKK